MSEPHAPAAIDAQLRPLRSFAARPSLRRKTRIDHRGEVHDAQGDRRQHEVTRCHADRGQGRAGHHAEDGEQADHPARQPDLRRRHEVGHVSLERALREVRAELEQRHERRDGEHRVRRRQADQEHEVEDGADGDVRLAPAESADRVVADGADRRLDEDGEDQPGHLQRAEGRVLDARVRDEDGDPLLEDDPDPLDDRDEPEPVDRQAHELAERQQGRRAIGVELVHPPRL